MEKRITPGKHLKKEDEPELLKAVNYALKEFDFAHQFLRNNITC